MKLVFVDETSDDKFKDYFGLCCAVIDSNFYNLLKTKFHKILLKSGWPSNIEFKGSYLFSATKGPHEITIDKRIELAKQILELNKSDFNSRMKYYYVSKKSTNHKNDYLKLIPALLAKAIPKPTSKKSGKNIISLNFDHRDDIKREELKPIIIPIIEKKSYVLLEDINCLKSGFDTVGILYADIAGYLYGRVDTISNDSELFGNLTEEQMESNGKVRKLRSSRELISIIKEFQVYEVKEK
jgi:hypothetical protein